MMNGVEGTWAIPSVPLPDNPAIPPEQPGATTTADIDHVEERRLKHLNPDLFS
jgi:hypothetical protein